jgi:hypothetical protein
VHRLTEDERRDFAQFALRALDHPRDLWTHAFDRGLGPAERALLLALPGLPARVSQRVLEEAFDASCAARKIDLGGGRFMKALERVEGSFLSAQRLDNVIWLSAENPSLLDFLGSQILQSVHDLRAALAGAAFFEQVIWLFDAAGGTALGENLVARDFSVAFDRTFCGPGLKGGDQSFLDDAPDEDLVSDEDRIEAMLKRFERSRALRDAAVDWLARRARTWLDGWTIWNLAYPGALHTAKRLIAEDAIEPDDVGRAVLAAIVPNPKRASLLEFRLLAEAYDVAPAVIGPRLVAERTQFIRFVDEALTLLGEHLDDEQDISNLEYVAKVMDVELPKHQLASAYEWIQEREEEAEREREDHDWDRHRERSSGGPRGGASGGGADGHIDAMFGRLSS